MSTNTYAAFLSYSSRYQEWVEVLHRNLERCLTIHGEKRRVFLDRTDLGVGGSWVAQLQSGLTQADQLILVVTPEALASHRVTDELEAMIARNPNWVGRVQVAILVDTPLPPFLEKIQAVDFEDCDETKYRRGLGEFLAGLLGRQDRRELPALAEEIEIPQPPGRVPRDLRRRLVAWLAPVLAQKPLRTAISADLGFPRAWLEGHPSWEPSSRRRATTIGSWASNASSRPCRTPSRTIRSDSRS